MADVFRFIGNGLCFVGDKLILDGLISSCKTRLNSGFLLYLVKTHIYCAAPTTFTEGLDNAFFCCEKAP